tara:strand:- start:596 stop:1204 length:609 start_codon:yes stop_codon:yes gene_type:complete
MPAVKHTIYDGCVFLRNTDLDLSGIGPVFGNKTLINGALGRGQKVLTVDGTSAETNFSVGDKLLDALSNRAIGTIASVDSATQITLQNGSHIPLANNAVLCKWVPFEIAAIAFIGLGASDAAESHVEKLIPATTKWVGTHLPDGATWSSNTQTDFGTGSADGTALDNAMLFSAGITIEGRWKYVDIDFEAMVYLKSSPTQTF